MSNDYFNADGTPAQYARGLSSPVRNEFSAIEAGFDLLPAPDVLAGNSQNYYVDSGSVNNIVISGLNSSITTWYDGLEFVVKAAYTPTGTVQIVPGALAAKTIVDQSGAILTASAFYAGQIITLRYVASSDKVQFVTTSDAAAAASAASAAASAAAAAAHVLYILPTVRTSNSVLTNADAGKRLLLTGTFTQTFDTSGMGAGWTVLIKNNDVASGSSRITIPSVDGATNVIMYPCEERIISYDGSVFKSAIIHPFLFKIGVSETFYSPVGYSYFDVEVWAAGGGGGSGQSDNAATLKGGGGAGAGGGYSSRIRLSSSTVGASQICTVGAGGSGGAGVTSANGNVGIIGGSSSFGTIINCTGGGPGLGGKNTSGTASAGGTSAGASSDYFVGSAGGRSLSGAGTPSAEAGYGSVISGAGGGAGGGEDGANALWQPEVGGSFGFRQNGGGAAGTSVSGAPTAGTAGTEFKGGGGGGSAKTVNGAAGGAGGTASGGGGGGSSRAAFQSGAGGSGGNGMIIICGVA